MPYEDGPLCDRHDFNVQMRLLTMHSDSAQPDVVVGLFECPECGYERRAPIKTSYEESQASIPAA